MSPTFKPRQTEDEELSQLLELEAELVVELVVVVELDEEVELGRQQYC